NSRTVRTEISRSASARASRAKRSMALARSASAARVNSLTTESTDEAMRNRRSSDNASSVQRMRWSNVIEWREADALLALDMMKSSLRTECKRHSSIEAKDFRAIVGCLSGA